MELRARLQRLAGWLGEPHAPKFTDQPAEMRPSPAPLSSAEARWLPLAFAVALVALGWGCLAGDVTDREAEVLGYSEAGTSRFALLTKWIAPAWRDEAAKAVSFLALATLAVSAGLFARRFGPAALWISSAAFAAAPMALWLGASATDDAMIALLAVSGAACCASSSRWRKLAGAGLSIGAYWLLVDPVLRGGDWTNQERWWAPPMLALTLGAPWIALVAAVPWKRWPTAWREPRKTLAWCAVGVAAATLAACVLPGRTPVFALAAAWCAAVAVGALAELYRSPDLHPDLQRRLTAALRIAGYSLPALLLVWCVYRIETVYQYMERTQAAFVVALALLAAGPALLRRGRPTVWMPMVLALLVGKGLWVHVVRAERDQTASPRPFAAAVAAQTAPDGVVWTDLPLGPAHRYYLQRDVRAADRADATQVGVVLKPIEAPALSKAWRRTARFGASPYGPIELAEPAAVRVASQAETHTK